MKRSKAISYLIITALLWSLGGLFIKIIPWHPLAIAGLRSGIAALVLIIYYKKPIKAISRYQVLGGISYAALVFLFVSANKTTTSANAILLQFTSTIWVAVLSKYILKKAISYFDWLIICLLMMGMVLFFIGDLTFDHTLGNVIAIFSGLAMAMMIVSFKLQANKAAIETILIGNIMVFILALPWTIHIRFTLPSLLAILVLGVFQLGISYIFFSKAIHYVSPLEAIIIPILEPILNPVWVLLFLGESISLNTLVGGMIILSTVSYRSYYLSKKRKEIA